MPSSSSSTDYRVHPPHRNTRSLDLDYSAKMAAAWVWHLHDDKHGITTEGRFISNHSRRKSSSSYDRKSTRFQREAAAAAKLTTSEATNPEKPAVWDCGSKLYDTFELISVSNRLDRSLMGTPAPVHGAPSRRHGQHQQFANSVLQVAGAEVGRTKSLPRSLSGPISTQSGPTPLPEATSDLSAQSSNAANLAQQKVVKKWARIGKAWKIIKEKVFMSKQMNLLGCKPTLSAINSVNKPLEPIVKIKAGELDRYMSSKKDISQTRNDQEASWKDCVSVVKRQIGDQPHPINRKHLHHHIHHHHHHYVHHNLASESARLSSDTISKLYAEDKWFL